MSYRYDMSGKNSQQQAIVRARDEEDRRREEERKKREKEKTIIPKPDFISNSKGVVAYKLPKNGDYEAISFYKDNDSILELRLSGTAIMNKPCGLTGIDVSNWLWETGLKFIKEAKEFSILTITSNDVKEQELITEWSNIRKEQKK
ncbi:hypothetical protein ACLHWY_11065 [Priestia aryabhattai]|uniref:hypothetical protein n=1 Tax=Priestia aryabhattai TaxID=412384 RepID=UPI003983D098